MPEKCQKRRTAIEPGDVKCPACGTELPEPTDPTAPQKAAVLAAALLPLVALAVFLMVVVGIIFAATRMVHGMHKQTANSSPSHRIVSPQLPSPAVLAPPTIFAPPRPQNVVAPPIPPVIAPQVPPMLPTIVQAPTLTAPRLPAPEVEEFTPQIAPPGSKLVIRGQGLAAVDHVRFVSSKGAKSVDGKIEYARDNQVIVTVPAIPFANDDLILILSSPGGMAVLLDEHTGATPWGTDGHLHDTAVICMAGDEIATHDNMVLVAREGSAVSVGDNSIAFLQKNVTLKSYRKNCQIYYDGPLELSAGVLRKGLIDVPALNINTDLPAFRVKPAPPDVDQ